ncbi:zinc finger fyve/phd-type [Holotrichia oblita]|uniref:Zinc finger fyve/phd-type n=1 Tax=Holotrichia oblita TaxID=644536 RepID=A0ACB9SWI1_HOLOL|nr:zinc finger fyve/phd-type [Holotrichia oblita]
MSCIKCKLAVNEKAEQVIRCDGCNRTIHILCSELTDAEIKCLALRPSSRRRIKYLCVDCEQGVHQIPKLITLINDLKEEIRHMKEKYAELTICSTSSTGASSNISNVMASEEVINEVFERNKRSHNIIIYNSTEGGSSKQDQVQRDVLLVQKLLQEVGVDGGQIKPIRLGKFDSTKDRSSRLIKVRLSATEDVFKVLRKFNQIKSNSQFSDLSVSPDRTPKQIAIFKSVKSELLTRIAEGESNLKIKYRNGIPTIVHLTSEN